MDGMGFMELHDTPTPSDEETESREDTSEEQGNHVSKEEADAKAKRVHPGGGKHKHHTRGSTSSSADDTCVTGDTQASKQSTVNGNKRGQKLKQARNKERYAGMSSDEI
jgi:hypothetical protein